MKVTALLHEGHGLLPLISQTQYLATSCQINHAQKSWTCRVSSIMNRWEKKTWPMTVMGQKSCMAHLRLVLRCFLVQGFTSSNEYRRGPHSGDYLGKRGKPWYPDPFGFEDARINPRGFHWLPEFSPWKWPHLGLHPTMSGCFISENNYESIVSPGRAKGLHWCGHWRRRVP